MKKFANLNPNAFIRLLKIHETLVREGRKMVKIAVDNDKCTGCGTCVDTCPVDVFEIKDEKSVPVNVEECLVCRACEVQCSESAIQVIE